MRWEICRVCFGFWSFSGPKLGGCNEISSSVQVGVDQGATIGHRAVGQSGAGRGGRSLAGRLRAAHGSARVQRGRRRRQRVCRGRHRRARRGSPGGGRVGFSQSPRRYARGRYTAPASTSQRARDPGTQEMARPRIARVSVQDAGASCTGQRRGALSGGSCLVCVGTASSAAALACGQFYY